MRRINGKRSWIASRSFFFSFTLGFVFFSIIDFGPFNLSKGILPKLVSLFSSTEKSSSTNSTTNNKETNTSLVEENCDNHIDSDVCIEELPPGGVQANMQLWLKAELGTNTTINGSNVTAWTDQSVNAYSANADVNATDWPVYNDNAINFNPGIEFDGSYSDDYSDGLHLGANYIFSNNAGLYIFAVCNPGSDGEKDNYILDFGNNEAAGYGLSYSNNHYGSYSSGNENQPMHSYGAEPALLTLETTFGLYQAKDRNGGYVDLNPITISELDANNINEADSYQINSTSGPVSIGRKSASTGLIADGGNIFNGSISEVIVFDRYLSANEVIKIESYLAVKYGISLSHDYISAGNTTIKTFSDGYNNQIFGIGREDASNLYQKQSKSVEDEGIVTLSVGAIAANNQSNAGTITQDESFLMLANDGLAVDTWNLLSGSTNDYRINRTWKIDNTNINQNITFTIDVDDPDLDIASLPVNAIGDYQIMFDIDGDFTNGGNLTSSLTNTTGSLYEITFNPGIWQYFTLVYTGSLVTPQEICNNLADDNGDGRTDEPYPGGVQSNMQLWLKAEQGTNTTTDGANINAWADQSINAYSANADINATDYPTFTENAINFNPGINFDGDFTDSYSDGLHLGSDYIFATGEGLHVFMVLDPNVDAETDNHCFDFGLAANGGYGMIYSNDDYGMYTNNAQGGTNTELTHTEGDEPALIEFEVDFNDFQSFFRNGTELSAIPVTISQLSATAVNESSVYNQIGGLDQHLGPVSIGRKSASVFLSDNGGRIFDGNISEVIVYNELLADTDKEKINSYLALKYGITLSHNYYAADGSVRKDITDGYASNIAGIGRDDCLGLNQKQSKSIESGSIITLGLVGVAATNQSNPSSFATDESYLIWANNGAAENTLWNAANYDIPSGGYLGIDRVWKFNENQDVQNVVLRVDVDDPNFDLPVLPPYPGSDGAYHLFLDDDGDFTNGGSTAQRMTLVSGSIWETTISDPSNSYFSIGRKVPEICNDGADNDGDGDIDCADIDCNTDYYATSEASTGVINSSFVLGAPDFLAASFGNDDQMIVDLGSALDIGEEYILNIVASFGTVSIEESIDGLNFFASSGSPYTINSSTELSITTTVHTRYIRITIPSIGLSSLSLDAVTYGNCLCTPTTTMTQEYAINTDPDIVGNNVTIAQGDSLTLDFAGLFDGWVFIWSGPNSLYQVNDSGSFRDHLAIGNIQANQAGVYNVIYYDTLGCVDSSSFTVNILTTEICGNLVDDDGDGDEDCLDSDCGVGATASNDGPFCSGDDINLTSDILANPAGITATGWAWSGPNGFSSTLQNPTIIGATNLAEGDYTVTITLSTGCTSEAVTTVDVNTPTVNINLQYPTVCIDDSQFDLNGDAINCNTFPDPVVYISASNGTGDGSCTTSGEFIQIMVQGCADCGTTVDLAGWSIQDIDTNPAPGCCGSSIDFVSGSLQFREQLTIYSGYLDGTLTGPITGSRGSVVTVSSVRAACPIWDSNGDTAFLYDNTGSLIDSKPTYNGRVNYDAPVLAGCLGGSPLGGTLSGNGVGGNNFSPTSAGIGTHAISYSYTDANGCNISAVDSITVVDTPTVSLTLTDDIECINSTILTLDGGSPTGGIYSGTGVSGGNFNATDAGLGTHTITYTYTNAGGCSSYSTDDITVTDLPTVSLNLTNDSECVSSNTLALVGGSPVGGSYSGTAVTGTNFDPAAAGAGVHEITYTYTDPTSDCVNTATDNIVVFALPTVSLNLSDTEDCVLNNSFNLNDGLPAGGSYSGTGVSGTNFNASTAGLGTHTITYTYTDANGCTNIATDDIEVVNPTSVNLTLSTNETCVTGSTITLDGGTPLGGTYSGTGVTGTSFDPSASPAGTGTIITYTYIDSNGCSTSDTDIINVYGNPSFSSVVPTSPSSCGGSDGSIIISATGGTGSYEYRLDSGSWQSSNTFNGLSAGNYDVYIRNSNGYCEVAYTGNSVVLSDPSNPTAQINIPTPACVNGSSNFTAVDAGAGATYSWNFGTGASPATATGIGPHTVSYSSDGNKTIGLTVNLAGCIGSDSESFTVNALPSVSLNLADDEECISSTILSLSGGNPAGGTYSGPGVSGTNFDASAAGAGIHTITYTYTNANGCVNIATDDIEVLALPTVSLNLTNDEDCVSSTSLLLNGGSPAGGSYSGTAVSGTSFNPSTAGVGSHTITYTYTTPEGCTNTSTDIITVHDFPTINLVNHTNPTSCGGTEGTITVSASGATGAFEYRLNSGTWQNNNIFNGLSAGSYNVFVRNANDFCEITYSSNPVILADPPATIVSTAVISNYTGEDITCVGASDGFATANGSGGTSPYTYAWSNGQTGDTLRNVAAGTYTVTATDAVGCQGTQTVTLNDPPPLGVTAVFTNPSCYGASDGAIDVTATGGVGAYTYAWQDLVPVAFYPFDGNTDDISGNDHHAVAVWGDEAYSNDAVDGQSFEFENSTGVKLDDGTFLDVPFSERTVIMDIKPAANNEKYILYEEGGWNNGIALGIKDGNLVASITSLGFKLSAFPLSIPNDGDWHEVGFIFDNGIFTLLVDGVQGQQIDIILNTLLLNSFFENDDSGLGDSFGNTAFRNDDFNAYEGLMDNVAIYDIAYTGTVTQVAGGDSSGGDRTGIPAGDYQVYVYDLNGCIDSVSLTLTQPDSLALTANITDVSCNGLDDGTIDLIVAGGTSPHTYAWSNSQTVGNINSLSPGSYSVTVTDANGCTVEGTYEINEPPPLSASASTTSNYNGFNVTCLGATNGSAAAAPLGGIPPYTYSWSNGQTDINLTNVGAGTHTVTVTDDNGCTTTANVTLTAPMSITVTTNVSSSYNGEDISCVNATDGQAQVSATNGAVPYTYSWSNGQTGNNLINVGAGTYGVTVTDANGCTAASSVSLNDPPPLTLNTNVSSNYNGADISCFGESDGSLEASASGGAGSSFTYEWSDGTLGATVSGLPAGTYSVTATDNFGCEITQSINLNHPSELQSSINITSDYNGFGTSCQGETDGNMVVVPNGGVGPYTYQWSNSVTSSNNPNIGAGTYFVTVTDANACTTIGTTTMAEPGSMSLNAVSNPPSDCGVNNGSIILNASGGVGSFEYSIDGVNFQSSNTFTGLSAGTYFAYIQNTYGTCLRGPKAIVVNPPEAPTIDNMTIINPTTSSSTDGGVLVSASGSGIAIEYSIDGINWQASNLFNSLSEGSYTISIRYVGFSCVSSLVANLVAGAGVVGQNIDENYCSDDLSGVSFVEVYYIPFDEDDVLSALQGIYPDACTGANVVDPVQTYVSVGIVEDGTIIAYDHWEDGFEANLSYPIQSTTEIWGDGIIANGIPPGYTIDILNAADIIVLNNAVVSTTRASVTDFDGGDKIGSRGNLSITRLGWAAGPSNFMAGALEVFPTELWGLEYDIPVGPNTDVNNMFEYTAATIMARSNNTTVLIDLDDDGTNDVTLNLNEGESELVPGFSSGGKINSDNDIQVHLVTGDICHTYEGRWFTLKPISEWTNSYFNPVATPNDGSDTHTDFVNAPTYVHLYNPNSTSIDVRWDTKDGYQGVENITPGGTAVVEVPENTGTHFYTNDGSNFYAIATIDSDQFGNNARNDWGFALTPENSLSSQITLVGFAPGATPTVSTTENSAPIWLTADHPSWSASTADITVCIDYNGDGGSLLDANGVLYDTSVVLSPLDNTKIYDPDGDQTSMRLWVCDGSGAIIAGAWGQSPADVTNESVALDLGVGLPNGIPFSTTKCVELNRDYNSNGLYDECDEVIYTLIVSNTGVLPLSTGSVNIIDTLPSGVTYIPNSTVNIINSVVNNLPDDGSGSAFPLDENGLTYNSIVQPGDSIILKFEAVINNISSPTFIRNVAHVNNGQNGLIPEVSFPAQVPTGPVVAGVPNDTTVSCENIPDAPIIGGEIYTQNNCEEMDTIAQDAWTLLYTDSEQGGNPATAVFDNNNNSFWHTEFTPNDPPHPHEIRIDLGANYLITGFRYLPRQDSPNGRIGDFGFYVTNDTSNWGSPQATGTFSNTAELQEEVFNTVSGRYIRLLARTEVNSNPWTTIAELDVLHCINFADETFVYNETSTQTSNGSSTDDCYNISRTWEVTDYCGQTNTFTQTITVEDNELPLMFNLPSDTTIANASLPPVPAINCASPTCIFATDNCDTDVPVVFTETNNPTGCNYNVLRTWTATDNCGNIASYTQTITVSNALNHSTNITSDYNGRDISCPSSSDGSAEIIVSGGLTPYIINWSNGQNGNTATGLTAGTYIVTVTDNGGCSSTDTVTLTPPPPIVIAANIISNYNGEDISCAGENDGSALATASGGTGSLSYSWSNGSNTPDISDLTAGNYSVTVTDLNGCTNTASVTLNDPAPINLSVNITTDISCPGLNDGEATANSSGGTGAISYAWSNGSSSNISSGLVAGQYYVTATDINGCFRIDSIIINDPTPITLSATSQNNPSTCGGSDGTITVSATGGAGSYEYRLGTGGSWQTSPNFTGLSAGSYDIYVRNGDGSCENNALSVVLDDVIPQSCPITFVDTTQIFCNEDINVALSVPASPDASGYTWTIPAPIIIVSGAGTDSLVLDMNNAAIGLYDICLVTNSACGDSPQCCATIEVISCAEDCTDGIDNDGDGNIDSADDECLSCDIVYTSNLQYIQQISALTNVAEDTLNTSLLISSTDALALDPTTQRFYFLEAGTNTPTIHYIDPTNGNQINTAVTIPATANVPALGFNDAGLAYAISENGELFSITTNAGGSNIPVVNLLGNIGAATLGDLAVDGNGMIWAVINSNQLIKIDPTVATPTVVNIGTINELTNFDGNQIEAVAFNNSGSLLVGADSLLYEVNMATVQATQIANLGVTTHDFASCAFPIFNTDIAVTKTVTPNGTVSPGDTLIYTITITNNGEVVYTGTELTDAIPTGTAYVSNSTFINGILTSDVNGNMIFETGAEVYSPGNNSGVLIVGQDAIVRFSVVIDCCPVSTSISNQGSVVFDGQATPILSDDPTLPGATDPTVVNLTTLNAPTMITAASNLTIDCDTTNQTTLLNNWLNSNGGANATVDCGTVNWSNDFTGLTTSCGGAGSVTVTFTASNECGLTTNTTGVFTIVDTIPPNWTLNPSDIDIECNGTADPRGEISSWLNSFGGGTVIDQCGAITVTNDYTIVPNNGCGNTGSVVVNFTATDECGRFSTRSATLSIVDTSGPTISSVGNDTLVNCGEIPAPVNPIAQDSCDTDVNIEYTEVTVYHPNASWKSSASCDLLHTVSAVSYNNQGTPGDTSDDEMSFTITVIGQNTGGNWNATVNGVAINGTYYATQTYGPFLSNGTVLNFSISDSVDGSCDQPVNIDAADY